jgi:hypothetical protein
MPSIRRGAGSVAHDHAGIFFRVRYFSRINGSTVESTSW